MVMKIKGIWYWKRSIVLKHFLVFQQVILEVLVLLVLVVDGLNIPHVSNPPVVVRLKFPLVSLDLYSQLLPLLLYFSYFRLNGLLRHLLPTFPLQELLQLLVVDIQWSEGFLFVMIGQPVEEGFEVIIIAPQLILNFLLLIRQCLWVHLVNKLIQLRPLVRLE